MPNTTAPGTSRSVGVLSEGVRGGAAPVDDNDPRNVVNASSYQELEALLVDIAELEDQLGHLETKLGPILNPALTGVGEGTNSDKREETSVMRERIRGGRAHVERLSGILGDIRRSIDL